MNFKKKLKKTRPFMANFKPTILNKNIPLKSRIKFIMNELDTIEDKLAFILYPPKGLIRRPFKK